MAQAMFKSRRSHVAKVLFTRIVIFVQRHMQSSKWDLVGEENKFKCYWPSDFSMENDNDYKD